MHCTDSTRNITRGLDAFNAGSYFDLSTNEKEPYLVCKSFNGTPGTVRVYDPTIVHTTINHQLHGCSSSVGSGKSTKSTAPSWDNCNPSLATDTTKKKVKPRIHLLTTIDAHEHAVTRMLIGGGCDGGKESNTKVQQQQQHQQFLATVSSKGTTIRVFGLPKGDRLWEWHRGTRACQFHSLSWNCEADCLSSYGSSGTIHIFEWQKLKEQPAAATPMENTDDHDDSDDDCPDFEEVHIDAAPRDLDKTTTAQMNVKPKPLLRRIGSSIKRHAAGSANNSTATKHRSIAKLKYKSSAIAGTNTATGSNKSDYSARSQSLVLVLLDRNDNGENLLVTCSVDGELRQYSVKNDGRPPIKLIQIEYVLSA